MAMGGLRNWSFTLPGNREALLLGPQDRVLGGLGDAELDDLLRRNLDLLPGRGVAADARLAVHQHQLADARNREAVLGLLVSEAGQRFEEAVGLLLGNLRGLGQ